MSPVVLIIAAAVVLLLAGAATVMLHVVSRQDRIAARIRALHGEQIRPAAGMDAKALRGWTVRAVSGFGQWILNKGLLPARTLGDLQQSLALAGLRGGNALSLFIESRCDTVCGRWGSSSSPCATTSSAAARLPLSTVET